MARWIAPISLCLAALGCASSQAPAAAPAPAKPCAPLPITVSVVATPRLNSLSGGEGHPVQLRIYQLKSDLRLRTASFEDVWKNEAATLEADLVSSDQQTIFPGEKKSLAVAPKPDAAYLALVALFREPQGKDWFLTYEIQPPQAQPPCPEQATPIPVWLDRMQLQDGTGRTPEDDASSAATEDGAEGS